MDVITGYDVQRRRSRVVTGLLVAVAAASALGIAMGISQLSLLARALDVGVTDAEANANDLRYQAVAIGQTVGFFATAAAWLSWSHRAYSNLALLGCGRTDHTPAMALAWWFVPLANLVRPYQITKELWIRSRDANTTSEVRGAPGTPALNAWWTLWIASGLLGQIVTRAARSAESIESLQSLTVWAIASDAAMLATALLAASIVRQIDACQQRAGLAARAVAALS